MGDVGSAPGIAGALATVEKQWQEPTLEDLLNDSALDSSGCTDGTSTRTVKDRQVV